MVGGNHGSIADQRLLHMPKVRYGIGTGHQVLSIARIRTAPKHVTIIKYESISLSSSGLYSAFFSSAPTLYREHLIQTGSLFIWKWPALSRPVKTLPDPAEFRFRPRPKNIKKFSYTSRFFRAKRLMDRPHSRRIPGANQSEQPIFKQFFLSGVELAPTWRNLSTMVYGEQNNMWTPVKVTSLRFCPRATPHHSNALYCDVNASMEKFRHRFPSRGPLWKATSIFWSFEYKTTIRFKSIGQSS